MTYVPAHLIPFVSAASWLASQPTLSEAGSAVAGALGPAWTVDQEIDYAGDVSIIVLPANVEDEKPAFVLFEKNGCVHVATISADEWVSESSFFDAGEAAEMLISAARA